MTSSLLRELREEDAEQVAALFVEAYGGARKLDAREVASWLRDPDLSHENLRVIEEDGRIVGYGDVAPRGDILFVDLAAPGRWAELLDWAEGQVTTLGLKTASLFAPHEHELAHIAEARGYEKRRESLTMEIGFDELPPGGDFGGLELRTYRDDDHDAVIAALNDAFSEDPFCAGSDGREIQRAIPGTARLRSDAVVSRLGRRRPRRVRTRLSATRDRGRPRSRQLARRPEAVAPARPRRSTAPTVVQGAVRARQAPDRARRRRENVTGALRVYERVGMHATHRFGTWQKDL